MTPPVTIPRPFGASVSKGGKPPQWRKMLMLREKHGFWCMTICILVFAVMSRDKPYQSRHGFDVVARVPFSYISGKLKAGLQISIWKALPWQIVSSEFMSKRRGRWPYAINPKAQRCQKAEKWVAETLSFHIQDHPSHAVTAQHREMEQKKDKLFPMGLQV